MKHKRETSTRSIDSIHFKLQKPISKDNDSSRTKKLHNKTSNKKKQRWWKNALFFFKWRWSHHHHHHHHVHDDDVHQARARAFRASISGPVYLTESRSGSTTPYRTTSRPSSGPLGGTLTPLAKGEVVDIPYLSLRDLTMEQQQLQQQQQRMSTSAMPIYLVTWSWTLFYLTIHVQLKLMRVVTFWFCRFIMPFWVLSLVCIVFILCYFSPNTKGVFDPLEERLDPPFDVCLLLTFIYIRKNICKLSSWSWLALLSFDQKSHSLCLLWFYFNFFYDKC